MKMNNKISLMDILLVLFSLFIIVILGIHLFSQTAEYDFSPKFNIYIHAGISKAENDFLHSIKEGDSVYDTETGKLVGVVESSVYTKSYESVFDEAQNQWTKVEYPDLYDIRIVISATVSEKNGTDYKIGQYAKLNVPSYAFSAEIIDITQYHGALDTANPITDLSENTANDLVESIEVE